VAQRRLAQRPAPRELRKEPDDRSDFRLNHTQPSLSTRAIELHVGLPPNRLPAVTCGARRVRSLAVLVGNGLPYIRCLPGT
jgi:hypothetical protein